VACYVEIRGSVNREAIHGYARGHAAVMTVAKPAAMPWQCIRVWQWFKRQLGLHADSSPQAAIASCKLHLRRVHLLRLCAGFVRLRGIIVGQTNVPINTDTDRQTDRQTQNPRTRDFWLAVVQ